MSKQFSMEQKVRRMKKGEAFHVDGDTERQNVLRAAKTLLKAGVIDFQIITRWDDAEGKFKVAAI